MRALSVRQPWAELERDGRKRIELRSWSTRYRGPLLICAGQRRDRDSTWSETDSPTGVARCIVELVDVRPATSADAHDACVPVARLDGAELYAWILRDPRPTEAAPVKGRLGLFAVDVSISLAQAQAV